MKGVAVAGVAPELTLVDRDLARVCVRGQLGGAAIPFRASAAAVGREPLPSEPGGVDSGGVGSGGWSSARSATRRWSVGSITTFEHA